MFETLTKDVVSYEQPEPDMKNIDEFCMTATFSGFLQYNVAAYNRLI